MAGGGRERRRMLTKRKVAADQRRERKRAVAGGGRERRRMLTKRKVAADQRRERKRAVAGGGRERRRMLTKRRVAADQRRERKRAVAGAGGGAPAQSKKRGPMVRLLAATVIVCVLSIPTHATGLIGADLGELTRDARAIARGRVVAVDAQWTPDRRTLETLVTLEVESYLKGALGGTGQFRVPGGTLGRFRSIVVGAPEFAVDDRVVVFLGARGPSVPYVLGFSQGAIVGGDRSRRPLPLSDFEQRVRALAGGAR